MAFQAVSNYLGLHDHSTPDPETQPIAFLRIYLSSLPPNLLPCFSSITTPKDRAVLPIIRNRRFKYVQSNPPQLQFAAAITQWPLLYDGPRTRDRNNGVDEKRWAEQEFLGGSSSTKHVGKLGDLLSEYEDEREAERFRAIRRQKAEDNFVPEEESDDETPDEPATEAEAKAVFTRAIRERFISGLLEGANYDVDWDDKWDEDEDREAEERWFDEDDEDA
ncbi:DUF2052 domain-containing protein [Mycena kentingensis (nom. inval.)]|nr:DUF2052 domain-containing protein [Mycena kentingensis (nom. inval.)]